MDAGRATPGGVVAPPVLRAAVAAGMRADLAGIRLKHPNHACKRVNVKEQHAHVNLMSAAAAVRIDLRGGSGGRSVFQDGLSVGQGKAKDKVER